MKDEFEFVNEAMLTGLKYKDVVQDLDEETGKIRLRMVSRQLTKKDILKAIVKVEDGKTVVIVVAKDAVKHRIVMPTLKEVVNVKNIV